MTIWKFDYAGGSEELEGTPDEFAARYSELQLEMRRITVSQKENAEDDFVEAATFERPN